MSKTISEGNITRMTDNLAREGWNCTMTSTSPLPFCLGRAHAAKVLGKEPTNK
jgi:hypothetical protein